MNQLLFAILFSALVKLRSIGLGTKGGCNREVNLIFASQNFEIKLEEPDA